MRQLARTRGVYQQQRIVIFAKRVRANIANQQGNALADALGSGMGQQVMALGHYGHPRDIASAVLYFATPAARFVTNQTLAVDAGFSIS